MQQHPASVPDPAYHSPRQTAALTTPRSTMIASDASAAADSWPVVSADFTTSMKGRMRLITGSSGVNRRRMSVKPRSSRCSPTCEGPCGRGSRGNGEGDREGETGWVRRGGSQCRSLQTAHQHLVTLSPVSHSPSPLVFPLFNTTDEIFATMRTTFEAPLNLAFCLMIVAIASAS